jgi:hypothetical protein
VLVGVGWLAYQKSSKKVDIQPTHSTTEESTSEHDDTTSPVNGQAVDDEIKETDSFTNDADGTNSLNNDNLSDEQLGL